MKTKNSVKIALSNPHQNGGLLHGFVKVRAPFTTSRADNDYCPDQRNAKVLIRTKEDYIF